jgi:hypothetical protein
MSGPAHELLADPRLSELYLGGRPAESARPGAQEVSP